VGGAVWLAAFAIACSFAKSEFSLRTHTRRSCSLRVSIELSHHHTASITMDILRALQGIGGAAIIPAAVRIPSYLQGKFELADLFFRKY